MITYVLILSLFGGYNGSSPAVTSVPGFKSVQACTAAGDQWLRALPGHSVNAVCVEVR